MRRHLLTAALVAAALGARALAEDDKSWEVVVLGPDDEPIPGVLLERRGAGKPEAETDAAGRAAVKPRPDGRPITILVSGTAASRLYELVGAKTVLRLADTIPVDVVVVD